jgi:hypothetical protein
MGYVLTGEFRAVPTSPSRGKPGCWTYHKAGQVRLLVISYQYRGFGMWRRVVLYTVTKVSEKTPASIFSILLSIEGAEPSETLESMYLTTRRHIPEQRDLDAAVRTSELTTHNWPTKLSDAFIK